MKKKIKRENNKIEYKGKRVYFLVILFGIFSIAVMLYNKYNSEETYLVNKGILEYTTTCEGYIIKNETIIDVNNTRVLVPTVSEGSRVSKNNIIATYRGTEYENYQVKLQEIDNKILEAIKDIDVEYSIEVNKLEGQVINSIISAKGISSLVEMQEAKRNTNDILSKRANIIGELSPEEAYIKELIQQRESLEAELKISSSNVIAPVGGIISYSIDGLEGILTKESIRTLNYEDVKGYISDNDNVTENRIKIISNYEAYIFVRIENIDNEYMEEGKKYKLKVAGAEISELLGEITKITETEQGYEVLFRITNGIENIVEDRQCEVEVIWASYEGLIVPVKAINKNDNDKDYVTVLARGDYVDIPVKVERKNKTYAIVDNYERKNVNDYILERYDQVIISSE